MHPSPSTLHLPLGVTDSFFSFFLALFTIDCSCLSVFWSASLEASDEELSHLPRQRSSRADARRRAEGQQQGVGPSQKSRKNEGPCCVAML
eukprot:COSAG01_NODE_4236_length_5216_cov_4.101231_5_plen_91_part_00